MQVSITMYNSELIIGSCLHNVRKVYPEAIVYDFGSEDSGPQIAETMGFKVIKAGRLDAFKYVEFKDTISKQSKRAFWVDADEVWPEHVLLNIPALLDKAPLISGFWRNLKVEEGKIFCSEPTPRGAVAWDTRLFEIHRFWPREKIRPIDPAKDRKDYELIPPPDELFCWHGVLLNLSLKNEKKNRWKKRAERTDAFAKLKWTEIKDLPFFYTDKRILEPASFDWYK